MITFWINRFRYKLCYILFKDVILDALTEALHPDFGYIWQLDGQGFKACEQAFQSGYTCAQLDFYRGGIDAWKSNNV